MRLTFPLFYALHQQKQIDLSLHEEFYQFQQQPLVGLFDDIRKLEFEEYQLLQQLALLAMIHEYQ